jgi:hypothetical protein
MQLECWGPQPLRHCDKREGCVGLSSWPQAPRTSHALSPKRASSHCRARPHHIQLSRLCCMPWSASEAQQMPPSNSTDMSFLWATHNKNTQKCWLKQLFARVGKQPQHAFQTPANALRRASCPLPCVPQEHRVERHTMFSHTSQDEQQPTTNLVPSGSQPTHSCVKCYDMAIRRALCFSMLLTVSTVSMSGRSGALVKGQRPVSDSTAFQVARPITWPAGQHNHSTINSCRSL